MPGQYSTIRDPKTGQLRKMDPSEAAQYMPIESPPPPKMPTPEQEEFVASHQQQPPPLPGKFEPPTLPPKAPPRQPPPLPPAEEEEGPSPAAGAVAGAKTGSKFGPLGMAAGAAAGYLFAESQKPQTVGSFEGATTTTDTSARDLRDLLSVTKQMANVGTPIKDALTTKAVDSRM